FADYVVIPAVNAWEVDPRIPAESASIMEPFGNAVHTVFSGDGSDIELATVVVLGCGPIGLFAVGVARAAGARQVVAVEPNEFRRGIAKQMGADVVIDPGVEDPVEAVRSATGGHGPEVVLEMSGVPAVIEQGTRMVGVCGDPRMRGAAAEAAREFGAGSGAVRSIAGTMSLHRELEKRFAAFKGAEDALMFPSGFAANAGTVAAILTREDVIVSDELNHA